MMSSHPTGWSSNMSSGSSLSTEASGGNKTFDYIFFQLPWLVSGDQIRLSLGSARVMSSLSSVAGLVTCKNCEVCQKENCRYVLPVC